jgi:hypothetical protein
MSIFGPDDDGKDLVVRKKHEHSLNVHAIGRYIVWYDEADEKYIYYSVRPRKNIDIDTGKFIEIKNGIKIQQSDIFELTHTRLDTSKDLYIMRINERMEIHIEEIGNSWSFILSFNPFTDYSHSILGLDFFGGGPDSRRRSNLRFSIDRTLNRIEFGYASYPLPLLDFSHGIRNYGSFYPINSKQLIHLSIGCETNTISLRVNGKPWRNDEFDYNHELTGVNISSGTEIGILSIYNRRLSKSEFIQHIIDYHVPNFTDNVILI